MQVASVAFEHQRFADTYATHLTCEILRFNLPPKAHVTYVTHLTCEILRLINKHDLKDYLLTPRTNVRIASAKHQNAFKFAALTLRTNVRVASKPADSAVSHIADLRHALTCGLLLQNIRMPLNLPLLRSARTCGLLLSLPILPFPISPTYAPHERAGCFFLLQTRQILQAVLRSARTCGLLHWQCYSLGGSINLRSARTCGLLQQNCTIVCDACTDFMYRVCTLPRV